MIFGGQTRWSNPGWHSTSSPTAQRSDAPVLARTRSELPIQPPPYRSLASACRSRILALSEGGPTTSAPTPKHMRSISSSRSSEYGIGRGRQTSSPAWGSIRRIPGLSLDLRHIEFASLTVEADKIITAQSPRISIQNNCMKYTVSQSHFTAKRCEHHRDFNCLHCHQLHPAQGRA
jgi:hypothetical protein